MSSMGIIQQYYVDGLEKCLSMFDKDIADAEKVLNVEGKTLRKANTEQCNWQSYYDQVRANLKALHKHYKSDKVDRLKSQLWKDLTEHSNIELSSKDKEIYILSDKKYNDALTILVEIEEKLDKANAICEAFRARGYALKNITELVLASVEERVI